MVVDYCKDASVFTNYMGELALNAFPASDMAIVANVPRCEVELSQIMASTTASALSSSVTHCETSFEEQFRGSSSQNIMPLVFEPKPQERTQEKHNDMDTVPQLVHW